MQTSASAPQPAALPGSAKPRSGERGRDEAGRLERLAVAFGVAALLTVYALRGGSYDIIVFGEFGVLLWWVIGLGLAFGLLPRRLPRREAWVALGAMGVLVVWTALGFAWTESDERTSVELARVLHHAGLLTLAVFILRPSTVGAAVAGVTAALVAICALALASRLFPSSFPVDRVAEAFSTSRLNYPLNYWNGVGIWGAMSVAMGLVWSAHARTAALRALALASVPLSITVVYLSYSRASVAGVALAAVAAIALARTRLVMLAHLAAAAASSYLVIAAVRGAEPIAEATGSGGRGEVLIALAFGAALCAVVALAAHFARADERLRLPDPLGRRVGVVVAVVVVLASVVALAPVADRALDEFNNDSSIAETDDPSERFTTASGNRRNLWESGLDAFATDRLKGTGPGTFEFWWNRDAVDPEHVRDAHSLYVESLGETGLVGLLAVLGLCGALLTALFRTRLRARGRSRTGAAAAALAGFAVWTFGAAFDWMWELTAVTAVALVLGACGCVAIGGRRTRSIAWPIRAGGALLAAVALAVQLPPILGTSSVRDSQVALARGDVREARRAADDAIRVWPWAAAPHLAAARAAEQDGRLADAERALERARARELTNWVHPLLLARLAVQTGDPLAALELFDEAERLRPLAPPFQ